jgi:hypothetical protein
MKKPSSKILEVIKDVMESAIKKPCLKVCTEGHLTSLIFNGNSVVPKNMPELRSELEQRGYLMFHSRYIINSEEVLSINITKI